MLGVKPRDLIEGSKEEKKKKPNLTAQFGIRLKQLKAVKNAVKEKIFPVV